MTGVPEAASLLELALREQQDLSAADRFAEWHERSQGIAHSPQYRELMPLSLPGAGEQYAFEVDLDACSGCKACVTACHRLNGLDEHETWRSVGLLQGVERGLPVLQHVTTACHHCVEPACLAGCPTLAYEKDAVTGIVRHLDDQCFGCQYCILMCPYEVPTYSPARGIVRKCDMCRQRLEENEPPACVQGCPNGAIAIRIVAKAALVERKHTDDFLPTAPSPELTKPGTQYTTHRRVSDLAAGDHDRFHAAHAHWPLVFMLVLTQMSVGILAVAHLLIFWLGWLPEMPGRAVLNGLAAAVGLVGAHLALLHLGRPLQAYRAWLGWRTSWLSREVLAFGLYVPLVIAAAAAAIAPRDWMSAVTISALELAAIAAGALAVYCSAMIYIATRRAGWRKALTIRRFALTAFLLGNAVCTACGAALAARESGHLWWDYRYPLVTMAIAAVVGVLRALLDYRLLSAARQSAEMTLRGTAHLLDGELRHARRLQIAAGTLGSLVLPALVVVLLASQASFAREAVTVICFARVGLAFVAEITERYLFFAASVSPRMPGAMLP